MKLLRMLGIASLAVAAVTGAVAQTWQRTNNNPPLNVGAMLLLTDGTVIAHQEDDQNGDVASLHWYKLTPDINGSYVNGTWTQIADLPTGYGPLFFGSAVLPDSRVIVEGGEYNQYGNGFTKLGAIYDPVANTWTPVNPPTNWNNIGDASTVVLANGTLMLANTTTRQAALLNASTLTWTATGTGKFDSNDEEGWALLPGGNVLTVDAYVDMHNPSGKNYELYNPAGGGTWSVAGTTPVQLWDPPGCGGSFEIGPGVLQPTNKVIYFGARGCGPGHIATYDVASNTWTAEQDFPGQFDAADAPGALEVNGNVIVFASPGIFNSGAETFEWDGSTQALAQIAGPPNQANDSSFQGHFLMLPSGQIMFTDFTQDVEIFTPAGANYSGWNPSVLLNHSVFSRGQTYVLNGFKFNGASQNNFYGDDYQDASNYPIVRLTNIATGHVFYARTHDHSSMAVGYNGPTYTHVDIPANMETGATNLQVIVNGIPSQNYPIGVH